jgi:hypothetical protein
MRRTKAERPPKTHFDQIPLALVKKIAEAVAPPPEVSRNGKRERSRVAARSLAKKKN